MLIRYRRSCDNESICVYKYVLIFLNVAMLVLIGGIIIITDKREFIKIF